MILVLYGREGPKANIAPKNFIIFFFYENVVYAHQRGSPYTNDIATPTSDSDPNPSEKNSLSARAGASIIGSFICPFTY